MNKLLSLLVVALGFSAHAQITSTFDTDADGWTFLNSTSSSPGTFNPSGGNPGGFASFTYASNTFNTTQHWVAPAKFLGNQVVRSLGMTFSFSLQQSQAGTSSSTAGDLRIEGGARGTIALVYSLPAKPAVTPAWSTYTVTLDETFPWRINSTTGPIATRTQIIEVLTRITAIEIRGTYASNATYTSGLDHVVLAQRTLLIAPTINSFSPTVGQPGSTITITGSQFDTNPTNNRVLLGGLRATVTAATPTQLTVTVPVGVATGFVSVTNLTTGLSARSNDRFVATFANGGRIITASFKPRVDIATAARSTGLRVGDMDDDGWPDLLMRYNLSGNPQVDIYRNLGTGGTLSAASFAPAFGVSAVSGGGTAALGLEVIDLDGDGKLDMITNGYIGINGFFYTYRNTSTAGNLSFETAETWEGLSAFNEFPVFGAADLDGDGRPEMMGGLTASGGFPPDFWILPNISSPGNIEFGDAIDFSFSGTIDGASFAVPVDLNTDGKLDLVVSGSSYFVVLTNTSTPGRLSFTVAFSYLKGTTNSSLGVEDINQDGRKDIFWKNGSANNDIVVLLNQDTDGIITSSDFPTQIPIDGDVSTGGSVSVGDVNGDGRLEFLATNNSNIGVFENRFEGGALAANAFVAPYLLPGGTGAGPTAPTVADLNRDGRPDLVVPLGVNRISLFENQNVAAPEIAVNTVSPLQGPVGSTVTITGRNFSPTPSENEVWFGSVRAPVVSATPNEIRVTVPPGAVYAPVSVRKGELASRYHLPFSTTFSAGVSFDNTHFAPPTPFTLAGANYDIEVGDLDLDGKPDVIAEANALVTSFFRNTHTTGGISTATLTAAGATSSSAANAKLVDVDGDGRLDIVGINGRTYPNQSTLGVISFGSDFSTGDGSNLDFADFNLDGKFDIARTSPLGFGSNLRVNENQGTVGMFVNAGMFGTFGSNISFTKPAEGGGIAATDLDNDGFPDIVVTNPGSDNISIFPNTQGLRVNASSFTSRQDIPVGDNPSRIYYGDFDRDAKNDLLLYHGAGTSATVLILLHNTSSPGNISFNRIDLTNPSATTVAHIADLDGDGKPEIITVSETGNRFSIFKNLHTSGALTAASFAAPFNTTVTAPRGLTTGDLNLDGKPEIIPTRAAGFLLVYENLIPNPIITIPTQPVGGTFCYNAAAVLTLAATGTTNINYQWQRFDTVLSSFVNLVESSGYAGVATPVLSINLPFGANAGDFRCVVNGDLASPVFSNTVTVVAVAPPPPPVGTGASVCAGSPATLTASGGSPGQYRWYTVATGGTAIAGETNATYTTPALTASTDFFVAINNGTCESARTVVTATINATPAAPTTTGATRCGNGTVTLSATGGAAGQYRWYTVATGGTAIAGETNATYTTPALTASTDFFVAINNGTCESGRTAVTATIQSCSAPPTISTRPIAAIVGNLSQPLNLVPLIAVASGNLDVGSITVVAQPPSGARATVSNGQLTVDYTAIIFAGKESITIRACDTNGNCSTQIFEIEVVGDVVVFNALSPNGANPTFVLQYIEIIPETKNNIVTIFDRWQNEVWRGENYNNTSVVFNGIGDGGNDLPTGTYFYKIEFASGKKMKTGFISLKR